MPHSEQYPFFKSYKFGTEFKTKVICGKRTEMLDLSYIKYTFALSGAVGAVEGQVSC